MGKNVGELHQYTPVSTRHKLHTKHPPPKEKKLFCMHLAIVDWAKQAPYTIPRCVETCNTTNWQ